MRGMMNREGDIRRENFVDRREGWREDCRDEIKN